MAHQLPAELQKLRRQLEASRWELRCAVDDLEHSLNLPSRAREAIASHPMRYALYALAGGALASRVIPMVFRMARPTMSAKMLRTMLQAVVPLAAPYVLQRLSQVSSTPSLPAPGAPAASS
ncbi:hypothetical protein [Verrucomicrobium spinosum]|uniref:hypothetical protein n=1 Tax=Verrucomicrobium spinosum TaxID=2736 RepID=UPI00017458FE|nr:hypothetical protein [Verrucomicrobium spinosum]